MKTKLLIFLIMGAFALTVQAPVRAASVHLDGIANAGWYADDLSKGHLYIYDLDKSQYIYQWVYGSTPLPWNSREALASDLADGEIMGTLVNNWQVQSAGDAFNNPANAIWKEFNISPGTYTLKLTAASRAYQLNEFRWTPNDNGQPVWNAYVQMYAIYNDATTGSFQFGDWSLFRDTELDLLTYYRNNVDGMQITIPKPATMYFYINDYNSVDNGASVTLEFTQPAPLPGGLVLFGSGLLALIRWRRR
jgi:hypothetical protein